MIRPMSLIAAATALVSLAWGAAARAEPAMHVMSRGAATTMLTDGDRWAAFEPTRGITRIIDAQSGRTVLAGADRLPAGGGEVVFTAAQNIGARWVQGVSGGYHSTGIFFLDWRTGRLVLPTRAEARTPSTSTSRRCWRRSARGSATRSPRSRSGSSSARSTSRSASTRPSR
jgi:hypothetical protein